VPFVYETYNEVRANLIHQSKSKLVLFMKSRALTFSLRHSRGELSKRIMSKPYQEQFCGIDFPRNHKLYTNFNRKIQQLIESGITEKYKNEHKKIFDPKFYEKPRLPHKKYLETTWRKSFINEPKVLTMKDLEFGFAIWLGSLTLPLIGFILEWLNRLKNLLVMKFIFAAYFEEKRTESSKIAENHFRKLRKLKTFSIISPYFFTKFKIEEKNSVKDSESKTFETVAEIYKNCVGDLEVSDV
jgi:hypothetical protein